MLHFEDLLITRLEENDFIQAIHNTLLEYYTVGVSPAFCSSLFIPIIEHSIRNKSQREKSSEIYSLMISQLHDYTNQTFLEDLNDPNKIFNDTVFFLKDLGIVFRKRRDIKWGSVNLSGLSFDCQVQLVLITTRACAMMARSLVHYPINVYHAWRELPFIFKMSGHPTLKTNVINVAYDYIQSSIASGPPDMMDDLVIENSLFSILKAGNDDKLVSAAGLVITMNLEITLRDPYGLLKRVLLLLEDPGMTIKKVNLILNLSYVLLKNKVELSWLDHFLENVNQDPEIAPGLESLKLSLLRKTK